MFGISPETIIDYVIRGIVVISALSFHEFAHAWAAYRAGDDTAYRLGRLTLNPLAHLDPIGTIMLFIGPIGWARPVPINPANFRRPRKDDIIVSIAGVSTNFLLALVWTVIYTVVMFLGKGQPPEATTQAAKLLIALENLAFMGVFINVALAIFNMVPIPPLDGSHVLENMLKGQAAVRYANLRRYGPLLLIGFVIFNGSVPILSDLIILITGPLILTGQFIAGIL